jgi:hypothetical protein
MAMNKTKPQNALVTVSLFVAKVLLALFVLNYFQGESYGRFLFASIIAEEVFWLWLNSPIRQ